MLVRGVAHRGYSAKYPENTLTAFQAAIDLNISHVELDVQLSKDGVPVLMHDLTLDRVTSGSGPVKEHTLAELRELRVGGNDRIATLDEALRLLKDKAHVLVELKQAGRTYPGLEEKALEVIHETGMVQQVIIIGFDHFSIERTRALDPDVPLGLTTTASMPYVFDFIEQQNLSLLGVPTRMLTPEYYQMMLERNVIPGPWVVDETSDMEFIAAEFPDSLITTNEVQRWADFYHADPRLHRQQ